MTQLTDDIAALLTNHTRKSAEEMVSVPIGALRAALTQLRRFDGFPLLDRTAKPDWMRALPVIDRSRDAVSGRRRAWLVGRVLPLPKVRRPADAPL